MSLAQQLLLRALVAWFWREPQHGTLVRWGTALHDRFMLEHFVWEDFLDVLADLAPRRLRLRSGLVRRAARIPLPVLRHGQPRRRRARAAPRAGALARAGRGGRRRRHRALRRFLGRAAAGSRSRASTPARHVVTCNGRRVPLTSTGRSGEFVAGVRFKAWKLPSALHPTIDVQAPLTFDIFDSWNGRSLGGCVYHVAHPGGRNYETFPVNSYEAEARRLARFESGGHTPGPFSHPGGRTLARVPDDARPAASDSDLMAGMVLSRQRISPARPGGRGPRTAAVGLPLHLPAQLRRDDGSRRPACARTGGRSCRCWRRSAPTRSTGASPPPTGIFAIPACSTGSMRTRPAPSGPGR